MEAVERSLRAVSRYRSDWIRRYGESFFWNESPFVTLVETLGPENALRTTIVHIISSNRSAFVQVDVHLVLLQRLLEFEMFPIWSVRSP